MKGSAEAERKGAAKPAAMEDLFGIICLCIIHFNEIVQNSFLYHHYLFLFV